MAHSFVHGGMGASSLKDGTSCLAYPFSLSNLSVELLESDLPVLCDKKELLRDSGGPGKFRGGLGQEISYAVPDGDLAPEGVLRMAIRGGRFESPYLGIRGGKEAPPSHIILSGKRLETGTGHNVKPGDRLVLKISGGGGYGDPMTRDTHAVEEDVTNGLVSIEAAKTKYGIVINEDTGKVDIKATEKLRRNGIKM